MSGFNNQWPTIVAMVMLFPVNSFADSANGEESRRALLIACSEFPNSTRVKPLPGAENDIARFEKLLAGAKYNFRDIETLAGWTEGGDKNPTAANIAAAFERLISKTSRNDQVFILMSGHGTQVDAIADTTKAFGVSEEPDGKDEAFIAADYGAEEKVIRDDTIGGWLDQLQSKGAHVWIVFDCCHSGSLTRGDGDEEPRRLLGTTLTPTDRAASKSAPRDTGIVDFQQSTIDAQSGGSLVALFAAQNFETTPEMSRPIGAAASPENKRGLLSYHLEYILHNLAGKASYRDIENSLANRYYAERGMRGPNPYLEGDLDRTVFGLEKLEREKMIELKAKGDAWELQGGVMDGVTVGTILSVTLDGEVVGTVEATEVALNRAAIRWTSDPPEPRLQQSLQPRWTCEISKQTVNPWKVGVRWLDPSNGISDSTSSMKALLQTWIEEQQSLETSVISNGADGNASVWTVCVATPELARRMFGIEIKDTSVLLLNDDAAAKRAEDQLPTGNEISVVYPAQQMEKLVEWLTVDFERLFRMQRLFQLAGLYGDSGPMLASRGVTIEFTPISSSDLHGQSRNVDQTNLGRGSLQAGDEITVQLKSTKSKSLWYTVLLIQSNGLIAPIQSGSIVKGKSYKPTLLEIEKIRLRPTRGNAAYVAVTVPVLDQRKPADFSYLAQLPIGVHEFAEKSATRSSENAANSAPSTTLGGLFKSITRSAEKPLAVKQDGSQIAVRSWCVTP